MIYGKINPEDSRENARSDFDEKSPILNMLAVAFDIDSDAIFLCYPKNAEHKEHFHWQHWKMKNSSLSAQRFRRVAMSSLLILML